MLLLMLATGALAGIASVGLLRVLGLLEHRVWAGSTASGAFAAASPVRRVVAVLTAGVITTVVRLLFQRSRAEPGGVLAQLWEQAGIIPLGKTVARSILSIVDVGLGAALGREGALKEMGGAIASRIALSIKIEVSQRRLLVACGMAAGMASAYNVPVGGALFGLEVLLGRIELEMVVPVIVCCAASTTVSRSLSRNAATYHIPMYQLGGPVVLAQSLVFGAAVGGVAALFVKALRTFTTVEQRNARLAPFVPLVALGALGIASTWLPALLGNGYDAANAALHHELSVSLLATLALLRFIATATCSAARIPGGLFTPMLSIGALLGGLVGEGLNHVWPGTSREAFALLGMGALLAGASHGPISSVVLVAELSYDYRLILPLVFACGTAALVSRGLERASLYRLGPIRQPTRRESTSPSFPLNPTRHVSELTCAPELLLEVLTRDPRPLFVIDEHGRLRGAFHPETARQRLATESFPRLLIVADLVDRDIPRLPIRASLNEARAMLAAADAPRFVPVVDDNEVLVGEASRDEFPF